MPGNRLSNYALAQQVAQLLRRLTAHGLTRDQQQAETLIRDIESRLCPHPPHVREHTGMNFTGTSADAGRPARRPYGAPNWRGK